MGHMSSHCQFGWQLWCAVKVRQVFEIFAKVANMVLANEPLAWGVNSELRIAYPVSAR